MFFLQILWLFWSLTEALLFVIWEYVTKVVIVTVNESSLDVLWRSILGSEVLLAHFLEIFSLAITIMHGSGASACLTFVCALLDNVALLYFVF